MGNYVVKKIPIGGKKFQKCRTKLKSISYIDARAKQPQFNSAIRADNRRISDEAHK